MPRIQWKLAALNTKKNTLQYFILAGELFLLECAGSGAVLPPVPVPPQRHGIGGR